MKTLVCLLSSGSDSTLLPSPVWTNSSSLEALGVRLAGPAYLETGYETVSLLLICGFLSNLFLRYLYLASWAPPKRALSYKMIENNFVHTTINKQQGLSLAWTTCCPTWKMEAPRESRAAGQSPGKAEEACQPASSAEHSTSRCPVPG